MCPVVGFVAYSEEDWKAHANHHDAKLPVSFDLFQEVAGFLGLFVP